LCRAWVDAIPVTQRQPPASVYLLAGSFTPLGRWRGGRAGEPEILASCYRRALGVADELGATSVAFPAISTGIFGYPRERAAEVDLNAIEEAGLVTRRRDPANRRVHVLELTQEGEALFGRLAKAAIAFDRDLRAGIAEADLAIARSVFAKLRQNSEP
jgi:hypothetical protein